MYELFKLSEFRGLQFPTNDATFGVRSIAQAQLMLQRAITVIFTYNQSIHLSKKYPRKDDNQLLPRSLDGALGVDQVTIPCKQSHEVAQQNQVQKGCLFSRDH